MLLRPGLAGATVALILTLTGCQDHRKSAPAHEARTVVVQAPAQPAVYCGDAGSSPGKPCVPPPPGYGPPRLLSGTLRLGLEEISFVEEGRPGRVEPAWLDVRDEALSKCLTDLGGPHVKPIERKVRLLGRPSEDASGSFGHMGVYPREIRLVRFLSGSPCVKGQP